MINYYSIDEWMCVEIIPMDAHYSHARINNKGT